MTLEQAWEHVVGRMGIGQVYDKLYVERKIAEFSKSDDYRLLVSKALLTSNVANKNDMDLRVIGAVKHIIVAAYEVGMLVGADNAKLCVSESNTETNSSIDRLSSKEQTRRNERQG